MIGRPSLNERLFYEAAPRAADPAEWPFRNHRRMSTVMARESADQAETDDRIDRRLAKMERCDD